MNQFQKQYSQDLPERVIMQLVKAEEYKTRGEHEKALNIAKKILVKDPSCIPAAEEVLDNLVSLQDFDEALKVADFVLSHNHKSYIGNYAKGFIALTENENDEALPYLSKANKYNPNNPEILRCLGWSSFHCDMKLKGIVTLERALNLRPDDPLILCDLGVCLLHENVFEKSINLFQKALALDPENARAQECLNAAIELEEHMKLLGEITPPSQSNSAMQSFQKTPISQEKVTESPSL